MGATRFGPGTGMTNLKKLSLLKLLDPIADDLKRVERALVEQVDGFAPHIRDQIQYLLVGSGKRLRPALALLVGGATGGVTDLHITIGVVVELIHLATLVHDDVLDEAELRHGQPSAKARWGNEISVLLGDCLFARALHLTASYSTTDVCRRVSAAANTVCAGEILQNQRRFDLGLSRQQYLDMINMKTGALFAVSCELGALLNRAPALVVEQMSRLGSDLGIAYQIYDDCVDIFGQEQKAGKSLGTDMNKGKLTLPLLLLLEHVGASRRQEVEELLQNSDAAERRRLMELVLGNGVVSESLLTIERYVQQARRQLSGLEDNHYTRTLDGLLDFIGYKSQTLMKEAVLA